LSSGVTVGFDRSGHRKSRHGHRDLGIHGGSRSAHHLFTNSVEVRTAPGYLEALETRGVPFTAASNAAQHALSAHNDTLFTFDQVDALAEWVRMLSVKRGTSRGNPHFGILGVCACTAHTGCWPVT
jgi:hypothetical protein